MAQANGSLPAKVSPARLALPCYAALQGAGFATLGLAWLAFHVLVTYLFPEAGQFESSWLGAFLLVPASFIPALVSWHSWACRKYGKYPRLYRLIAEVAFAVEVVGALVVRGIA